MSHSNWSFRRRIEGRYIYKLAAIFAALVVATGAVGAYTYTSVSAELHESVHEQLAGVASGEAEQLSLWLEEREQMTRMLAEYSVLESDDAAAISAEFGHELENFPEDIEAIYYVNAETNAVVASSASDAVGTTVLGDVGYVKGSATFTDADDVAVTDVYESDGQRRMAFVTPVSGASNRAVVLVSSTEHLQSVFSVPFDGAFVQVVDGNGVVEFDSRGTAHHEAYAVPDARALTDGLDGGEGVYESAANAVLDEKHVVAYANAGALAVIVHTPTSSAYHLQQTVAQDVGILLALVLVGLGGTAFLVKRTMLNPLDALRRRLERLRGGELDIDLDTDRADELGSVLRSVDDLRNALVSQRADAKRYAGTMATAAAGDLTARMDADSESADMQTISTSFNGMMDDIETTVETVSRFSGDVGALSEQVAAGAREVSGASEQVANSVEQISRGANDQTDQLTSVAGEMDELSATVEEIASTADELSESAAEAAAMGADGRVAAEDALDGMASIREETESTVEEIREFEELTEEVGDIVGLIRDVAEQTNLLALNANIEAARAGEAGKGFGVVADEVKQLAEETTASAERVGDLIGDIQTQRARMVEGVESMRDRVDDGTDSVETAIDALEQMSDRVEETEASVGEVNEATLSQASSTEEVSAMVQEVSSVSEETSAEAENVSAAAEEQAASLNQVTASVETLSKNAGELRELLSEFETSGDAAGGSTTPDYDGPAGVAGTAETTATATDGGVTRDGN